MCEIQASPFYRFNAKTVAMATQQPCCKRLSLSAPSLLCPPTRYTGTRRRRAIMICRLRWGVDGRGPAALSFISTSLSVFPTWLLINSAFTLSVSVLWFIPHPLNLTGCPVTREEKSSRNVMRDCSVGGGLGCLSEVFLLCACWWGRR